MSFDQTTEKLRTMKMGAMATALEEQLSQPRYDELSFEERVAIIVDREWNALDTKPRAQDQPVPLKVDVWRETDAGHGRIEEREVYVCSDLSWLTTSSKWKGLSYIAMATSRREVLGTAKISKETRFYIGSEPAQNVSPDKVAMFIRRHWSIENSLHWTLDVAFREDQLRHRTGEIADNLGMLRRLALALLKNEDSCKLGVANKRKKAGWSNTYLLKVLAGAVT